MCAIKKLEKTIKMLIIFLTIFSITVFAAISIFLYVVSEYVIEEQTTSETVIIDADDNGNANYAGGDIYYNDNQKN